MGDARPGDGGERPALRQITVPGAGFFAELDTLDRLRQFIEQTAKGHDILLVGSARAMLDLNERAQGGLAPEQVEALRIAAAQVPGALARLAEFEELLYQMLYARAVDTFLMYLTELLALIFRTRPETLRSDEQVSYAQVLEYATMEELVKGFTEERVTRLSFLGMKKLADDLERRMGFSLFTSERLLAGAISVNEVRNLVVHNRAVVNRMFLARQSLLKQDLGTVLQFDQNVVLTLFDFLHEAVHDIDDRAVAKFGLPVVP